MILACVCLLVIVSIDPTIAVSAEVGYFWHLTDLHLDLNYSGNPNCDLGRFGDYRCDSPLDLVNSAISAAQRLSIDKPVDFVIWNGDNTDHKPIDADRLMHSIRLISGELRTKFPTPPFYVLPSVGNHDVAPSNHMSPMAGNADRTHWCRRLASEPDLWGTWIRPHAIRDAPPAFNFSEGCFYSHLLPSPVNSSPLLLVSLNGLIWYLQNPLSNATLADPLGQLDWLNHTFQWARRASVKVLIVSHFPPGASENDPRKFRFLHEHINRRFLGLLERNADLIMTGLFAHEHVDTFRVLSLNKDKPILSLFVSPSVSPMRLPGLGSFNPRIRLYFFRRSDYLLLGYEQYYLNLSLQSTNVSALDWLLEYTSADEYQLKDLSPTSMNNLLSIFEHQNDSSSKSFWSRYWSHELGRRDHEAKHGAICARPTNFLCRCEHLCAMRHLDLTMLDSCLADCNSKSVTGHPNVIVTTSASSGRPPDRSSIPIIVGVIVAFLVILVGVVVVVNREICRKRGHSTRRLLSSSGPMGGVFFSAINSAIPVSFTNSGSERNCGGRLSNGAAVVGNGTGYGDLGGNVFHADIDNCSVVTLNTLDNDEKYYPYQLQQKSRKIEQPAVGVTSGKQAPSATEVSFNKQRSSNGAFLKPVVRSGGKQLMSSYSLSEFASPDGLGTGTQNKNPVYGLPKLAFAGRNQWIRPARAVEYESMTTCGDTSSLVTEDRPSLHHKTGGENYFSDDEEAFADDEGGLEEEYGGKQFLHHDRYLSRMPPTPSTNVVAVPLSNVIPVKEIPASNMVEEIAQSLPVSNSSTDSLSVDQDMGEAFYLDHDRVPLAKQSKAEDHVCGSSSFIKRFSRGGSRLTSALHTPQLMLTRFSRSEDASKQCEGGGIGSGGGNSIHGAQRQPGTLSTLKHSQSVTLNMSQQSRTAANSSSSSRPASVASPHRTSAVIQGHQVQERSLRTSLVNGLKPIQAPLPLATGPPAVLPVYSDEEKARPITVDTSHTDLAPPKATKVTGYDYVRI